MCIQGDTALVGASLDDEGGDDAGAVYVFVRDASTWTQHQKLLASDGGGNMGSDLDIDGDTAIVGGVFSGPSSYGGAYVFVRSGATWSEQAKLFAGTGLTMIGNAVSIDGDAAAVGAPLDSESASYAGAAHVFVRSGSAWSHQQKLTVPLDDYEEFGCSVSGDTLIVGVHRDQIAGENQAGSAYVFQRAATTWSQQAHLTASNLTNNSHFGRAVDLLGDTALVGADSESSITYQAGAAYVFQRTGATWSEQQRLVASDPTYSAQFGGSVGLDATSAIIGAYQLDAGSFEHAGAAYAFILALSPGSPCGDDEECVSTYCVDGVCCDGACPEPCAACGVAGSEGTCTTVPDSDARPECEPYLCDGQSTSCPSSCDQDYDCSAGFRCEQGECVPKAANGESCGEVDECVSGYCVEGVCCDDPCSDPCESCTIAGSQGTCTVMAQGATGQPPWATTVCDGTSATCPDGCTSQEDCAAGHYCEAGSCVSQLDFSESCTDAVQCQGDYCLDGVCCLAAVCAPYRCGFDGLCRNECASATNCVPGYSCTSGGVCEPTIDDGSDGGCGCRVGGRATKHPAAVLMLLAMLWAASRRRRGGRASRLAIGGTLVAATVAVLVWVVAPTPIPKACRTLQCQRRPRPRPRIRRHDGAYMFERTGSSWTQNSKLNGSDTSNADSAGIAVSLHGVTGLVGALQRQLGHGRGLRVRLPARPGLAVRRSTRVRVRPMCGRRVLRCRL